MAWIADGHSLAGSDDQCFNHKDRHDPRISPASGCPASSMTTESPCDSTSSTMRRSATAAASDRPLSRKYTPRSDTSTENAGQPSETGLASRETNDSQAARSEG